MSEIGNRTKLGCSVTHGINISQSRNATISNNSRTTPDIRDAQLSDNIITAIALTSQAIGRRNASWRLISLPLRSGRSTNLLERFKS
jgi:hypothetical protein